MDKCSYREWNFNTFFIKSLVKTFDKLMLNGMMIAILDGAHVNSKVNTRIPKLLEALEILLLLEQVALHLQGKASIGLAQA